MMRLILMIALCCVQAAYAYEYKLQFNPQGGANGLIVAGYQFDVNTNTVVGNCSYYTVSAGSGRGSHSTRTNHYGTCTWDLYGNLVSLTPVTTQMQPPAQASQKGTELIYAKSGSSSTGVDTRGFGFVDTLSSHYSWTSTNNSYAVIPYASYPITATLISDGDFPLAFNSAQVVPTATGFYTPTPGTATVSSASCPATVQVGISCSINVTYNPKTIKCTGSPYGYAYTKVDISLVTDAGTTTDFTEGFTITGVPICDD